MAINEGKAKLITNFGREGKANGQCYHMLNYMVGLISSCSLDSSTIVASTAFSQLYECIFMRISSIHFHENFFYTYDLIYCHVSFSDNV